MTNQITATHSVNQVRASIGVPRTKRLTQLVDTPDTYENQAGKVLAVKQDETGTEFVDQAQQSESDPVFAQSPASQLTEEQLGLIDSALQSESDPTFTESPANSITQDHITTLNNTSGTNTGDQVLPTRDSLGLDTDDTVTFANLSGTNTGDQDLSGLATTEMAVPSGGTTDQVLAKNSNTNYDLKWLTVESGGSGMYEHDCVVDGAGNYDYTTLKEAIDAGHNRIFIVGETTETAQIDITRGVRVFSNSYQTNAKVSTAYDINLNMHYIQFDGINFNLSSNAQLNLAGVRELLFENCRIYKSGTNYNAINFDSSCQHALFDNCRFQSQTSSNTGTFVSMNGNNNQITNSLFDGLQQASTNSGQVTMAGFNNSITSCTLKFTVQTGSAGLISSNGNANLIANNTFYTLSNIFSSYVFLNGGSGTLVTGNMMSSSVFRPVTGVTIYSGTYHQITNNSMYGVKNGVMVNGNDCLISGNQIRGTGTGESGYGVRVYEGYDRTFIVGNVITNHTIGVNINNNTCDDTHILNNNLTGNGTAYVDNGTGTVIANNLL